MMGMAGPRGGPRKVCWARSKPKRETLLVATAPRTPRIRSGLAERDRSATAADSGHHGDNPVPQCV